MDSDNAYQVRFNYYERIPFNRFQTNINRQSDTDPQYSTFRINQYQVLKKHLFNPKVLEIVAHHKGHKIVLNKCDRQSISVNLTDRGVFISLFQFKMQSDLYDLNQKSSMSLINIPNPSIKDIYLPSIKKNPDSVINYSIHPELFDCLVIGFDPDTQGQIKFYTTVGSQSVQVILNRQDTHPSNYQDLMKKIQYQSNRYGFNSIFGYKEVNDIFQGQYQFSKQLIKRHLKTINPSIIYQILPIDYNNAPGKHVQKLYTLNTVPNQLRLLFSIYMLFKSQLPNNPVYGENDANGNPTLNLQYINFKENTTNPEVIVFSLIYKAQMQQMRIGVFSEQELTNILASTLFDAGAYTGLVFRDEKGQVNYITKQSGSNWVYGNGRTYNQPLKAAFERGIVWSVL